MRITVIGTGYLGAVHAACMAASGHEVLGVDVDPAKLAALSQGHPPFFEPGLPELLRRTVDSGALRFTDSLQEAGEFGEVHFVCVGTPQQPGSYAADLRQVYAPMLEIGTPYISTDLATAELVKVAANSFLATKISFINAMADVCDAAGGDVVTLADAIGYDTRIGRRFLSAGIGFGGGCLPKDIRAFMARAGELGVGEALSFLKDVDELNMRRRQRAVELARELVGGSLLGKNIAVLGAAFKPDSDDVRDSPALNIAATLQLQGAQVRVHDPQAIDNARALFPTLDYALDVGKACEQADLVLHLTEWRQYRELDPAQLAEIVRVPRILDGRNTLDVSHWRQAGWTVRALGRWQHCEPSEHHAA